MKLYAVVDQKSSCAEYFIAACDEDAMRIWYVMAASSRPMFEFLEDYYLEVVCDLSQTRPFKDARIAIDGVTLKRQIDYRREQQNEKSDV